MGRISSQLSSFLLLSPPPFLLDYHDVGAADLTDKTTVPRSRPYLALFFFLFTFFVVSFSKLSGVWSGLLFRSRHVSQLTLSRLLIIWVSS
jgi:hypothetical protein